ncbi:MAG: hypothetical protein WA277_08200 [Nitrospirota bacterium]
MKFISGEVSYQDFKSWCNCSFRQGRRRLKDTPHIYIGGRALIPCNANEPAPKLENQYQHIISGEYHIDFCMALGYSERHARRKLKEGNYSYLKDSGVIYLKENNYHKFIHDNYLEYGITKI